MNSARTPRTDSGVSSPVVLNLGDQIYNLVTDFSKNLKKAEAKEAIDLAFSLEDNLNNIVDVYEDVEKYFLRLSKTFNEGTVCLKTWFLSKERIIGPQEHPQLPGEEAS